MADAFSFAYTLLKEDDMPFNKKKDGGSRKERNLENARASKVEHAQERMRAGPTEDPDDPDEYDTQDGSEKPIGEDEDTGYDLRTTEEREDELKMRKSAFDMALKALNPSQQDDEGVDEEAMRHFANMQRMNQRFGGGGEHPLPPHEEMPLRNVGTTSYPSKNKGRGGANTLPPNPANMPPGADAPSGERGKSNEPVFQDGSDFILSAPTGPVNWPRPLQEPNMPVSSKNPEGKISDARLQSLAAEFGIPFAKALIMLKALPEQQMFVERTRRQNAGEDNPYEEHYDRPEIDDYGARSLGTVHPAIQGMLQRKTDAQSMSDEGTYPVNLNLDSGREEGRRMHADTMRNIPSEHEGAGTSIAQGPEFNRRQYDSGGPNGERAHHMPEEIYHNPNRAAKDGPFDDSRHASGHTKPERFMTGYGYSPSHRLSHPKPGEWD